MGNRTKSILLAFTGLNIDGGIAVVSRCIRDILDGERESRRLERVDRLLFWDEPDQAPPPPPKGEQKLARGSKLRFVFDLWIHSLRRRPDLVIFDLVGLARSVTLPIPGFRPKRYAIFAHGIELDGADADRRGSALRGAWRIFANSDFTGQRLRREYPDIADRIFVTPLCIDPDKIELWQASERPTTERREPAALIVGRMWSEERGKGHDALLDAFPDVLAQTADAKLWIVGGGDDVERLVMKATELGIRESVVFWGRVEDGVLLSLYRRASVFAMPSRQEGFGLVYAEAMWHGLPCIGSTADAAQCVIDHEETGILVTYDDRSEIASALKRLIGDEQTRDRMGRTAAEHARRHFSFDRFREDFLAAAELADPGVGRGS